jgi:hypothetical protein
MNKKRGYITTKLGGKNRTLHFSMNFWCHFTDTLGIGLNDLDSYFTSNKFNLSTIRTLLYSGLIAYDNEEKNPIDYTIYDVGSWLEDFTSDDLKKVMEVLTQSRILGNDMNMGIPRNTKTKKK